MTLCRFLDATNAYGDSQWAFRPKRSCRTLLTVLMLMWLMALSKGMKVGIFFSDIQGAFDRVDRDILLQKCKQAGV